MKILHIITNADLGGAQRVVLDLCDCAISEGNEVAVASMPEGPMWNQLNPSVHKFFLSHMVKKISLKDELPCILEIKKIIKFFSPDIIHLHCSKAGLLGRIAAGKLRKHTVYTVHGFDQIRKAHKKFLPLEKIFKNFCKSIVAVSEYDVQNMRLCGISKNVTLIQNAVKKANYNLPFDSSTFFPANKKIILSVARIAKPKRLDIFNKTAEIIKNKYKRNDISFIWIGSTTDTTLSQDFQEYFKQNYVLFPGETPFAAKLISNATLFVLFSDNEGMPMTILEALSSGKPVLASNVGGIPELVSEKNGYLVNMNKTTEEIAQDAASFINYITLDDSISEYTKMCNNSSNKYEESYTLEKMWKKYKELYESML